jgi:staphylococcal nuclease domain-containing protein 1
MEKSVSKSEYPKVIKGIVKQIQSADFITIWKTTKGASSDHQVFLAGLQAPKLGTNTWEEEPYAFEAWEFLRKKAIGQKCEFHIEYKVNDRECGTLFIGEENVNLTLAWTGFVKVMEKKNPNQASSKWHEELEKAVEEFKWKNQGVYGDEAGHKWKLTFSNEEGFDPKTVIQKQNKK